MEAYLYSDMFKLEQDHWWFAAKHRIVLEMLRRALPAQSGRMQVADLGCGCGRMLQLLCERYEAIGVDSSSLAVDYAGQRNVKVVQGHLPDGLPLAPGTFDAVLLLDVLEHLDEDVASAAAAKKLLKPAGIAVVTVPAYQWLYGPRDAAHHHRRRYTRRQFCRVLGDAGLHVQFCSYYNTLLFPLALLQRLVQRIRNNRAQPVEMKIPPGPINEAFRAIFASERHLLGRCSLPFGLSLIAVATPARN